MSSVCGLSGCLLPLTPRIFWKQPVKSWQVGEALPPSRRLQGLCSSSSTRRQGKLCVLSMRFKVLRERLGVGVRGGG